MSEIYRGGPFLFYSMLVNVNINASINSSHRLHEKLPVLGKFQFRKERIHLVLTLLVRHFIMNFNSVRSRPSQAEVIALVANGNKV